MTRPEMHRFEDAGGIPYSRLSVLVYHDVENAHAPRECEELVACNLDAYRHLFRLRGSRADSQHERSDRHAGSLNRPGR
jgi:hypothetical protein